VYVLKKTESCQSWRVCLMQCQNSRFSVCSLRDDNVITSKPTWKPKHTNSILEYSEYFCQISSKSLLIILSYTVLKLRRFFETQCICVSLVLFSRHSQLRVKSRTFSYPTCCFISITVTPHRDFCVMICSVPLTEHPACGRRIDRRRATTYVALA